MDIASTNENNYIGAAAILEKKKKYIIPCLGHFYSVLNSLCLALFLNAVGYKLIESMLKRSYNKSEL